MLALKTLATGSTGNCYALEYNNKILLLDIGISLKAIKQGIDFRISDIVGAVVTHEHADHSKAVREFYDMAIPVWEPYITNDKIRKFGDFSIQAFSVPHDDTECYGFYIKVGGQKIVYATDYEYIPVSFKKLGVNHMILECNYQKELVEKEAENREHVLKGHAELQTVLGIVKENQTECLQTVLICHLSHRNSNPEECKAEIEKVARKGVNVLVASKGAKVEL